VASGHACTGKTWFQVAPTFRYELAGNKPKVVSGKDIFLHIAGTYGDATNHNLEFGGPGLKSVPMDDRRTIATQGAEVSADFTTFPADERCREFLDARTDRPYEPVDPDPDAEYAAVRTIDLTSLEPYVARPGGVANNAIPISEIEERPVNQCFIGSCANGQLEDLRIAADLLRGHKVAPGVRLIVTPASQAVYTEAIKAGYIEAIADGDDVRLDVRKASIERLSDGATLTGNRCPSS
jgi:3-isopropylmalate/(R)-2-methylmalate dehydratase large subunit